MKDVLFLMLLPLLLSSLPCVQESRSGGEVHWVRVGGGAAADFASDVAIAPDGSVIVVGSFRAQATFGENGAATTLTSAGESDLFVARYHARGGLLWAYAAGGPFADQGTGIQVDPHTGDLSVRGRGYGALSYRGTTASFAFERSFELHLTGDGSLGEEAWIEDPYDRHDWPPRRAGFVSGGGLLEVGGFTFAQPFPGEGATRLPALLSQGLEDGFVVEYGPNGFARWALGLGGSGKDAATAVALSPDEPFCIVAGRYEASADLGATGAFTARGLTDVFLARVSLADLDGDGLSDVVEGLLGSDPANPDTDGDLYWDSFEVTLDPQGADPTDPASRPVDFDRALRYSRVADGVGPRSGSPKAAAQAVDPIPDADELALLAATLNDPGLPFHAAVRAAWEQNVSRLQRALPGPLEGGNARRVVLAGLLTLGSSSGAGFAALLQTPAGLALHGGGAYQGLASLLGPQADPDGDGLTNLQEYELAGGDRATFVANALR